MTINERLIEYVDYLGVSQRQFTKGCGISEGALRNGMGVSSRNLGKIKRKHPMLNLEWVLFGEGAMEIDPVQVAETKIQYEKAITIDKLVDKKVDRRFDVIKETLAELVANEIEKELSQARKANRGES